jgi:hypothetical protein
MHKTLHLTDQNIWQIGTFSLFVFTIFVFAVIYYRLYRRRRSHFTFNSDVLSQQKNLVRNDIQESLKITTIELQLLSEALDYVQNLGIKHLGREEKQFFDLTSGRIMLFYRYDAASEGIGTQCNITFYSAGYARIGCRAIDEWWQRDPVVVLNDVRQEIIEQEKSLQERLGTISTDTPDVWSFWDFIYFSTITQTTVGYGDILPNSTKIRLCVCAQIILGYSIIIVVLNLVFASH